MQRPLKQMPSLRAPGFRRGATSPAALVALLAAGSVAVATPEIESRRRDAADDALTRSAMQVVTTQRAYAIRTGHFYLSRHWLREGQHDRLVLPLATNHRVLTYYSNAQRGLIVVVGDVPTQRTCSAVVGMRPGDRPTTMVCADDIVPE